MMSGSTKSASVSSIQPHFGDSDHSTDSHSHINHNMTSTSTRPHNEMEQVGRNTETTSIASNGRKDSYSATRDSHSVKKDGDSVTKDGKSVSRNGKSGTQNDKSKSSAKKSGRGSPKKSQVQSYENMTCAMRPKDENIMDTIPFYKRCHHKFTCKVFVFLIIGMLNVADLISDWLLFRDVAMTENGLVYGPVEDYLKYLLLAFSIIGTLTFTFEVVNLWWEIFRNNPWVDSDLSSAITIWIEDVPQIAINVAIVVCREEAISYFQLVKASVIILGAIIRIAVSLFKYCGKKALHDLECASENKESCRHVVYRAFIMVGLFLTLAGAVAIFMFTQSERNPNGSINFKLPHSVLDGEFDDQKYFQNVSIYFSKNLVDFNAPQAEKDVNLIKLVLLNDIRKKDYNIQVNVAYEDSGSQRKFTVTQTPSTSTTPTHEDCFTKDSSNPKLSIPATCTGFITTPTSELIFTFHFIEAKHPGLIFGDVTYNVKQKTSGVCTDVTFTITDNIEKRLGNQDLAAMHYFRTNNVNGSNAIIHVPGSTTNGNFYSSTDLIDVDELWKTGFGTCKSSGSQAPHFDADVAVKCP